MKELLSEINLIGIDQSSSTLVVIIIIRIVIMIIIIMVIVVFSPSAFLRRQNMFTKCCYDNELPSRSLPGYMSTRESLSSLLRLPAALLVVRGHSELV